MGIPMTLFPLPAGARRPKAADPVSEHTHGEPTSSP